VFDRKQCALKWFASSPQLKPSFCTSWRGTIRVAVMVTLVENLESGTRMNINEQEVKMWQRQEILQHQRQSSNGYKFEELFVTCHSLLHHAWACMSHCQKVQPVT
jgi:hypothetical protein